MSAGAGDIDYVFSSTSSLSQQLAQDLPYFSQSSGTVRIQSNATSQAISAITGSGLTGTLELDFPGANLSTVLLDTSAGNASISIVASSLVTYGPVNVGVGTVTLNTPHVAIGGTVAAGDLMIQSGDQVSVDGSTATIAANAVNNGSLTVAAGSTFNIKGSLTGSGTLVVGNAAGSGTVAYYRLEGTPGTAASGSGTIIDSSGNGLNGTAVNGPVYSSSVPANFVPSNGLADGSSLSFDGTSQQVIVPDSPSLQLTKSLTLEAYVLAEPLVSGSLDGNIIFRGDNTAGFDPYRLTIGGRRAPRQCRALYRYECV